MSDDLQGYLERLFGDLDQLVAEDDVLQTKQVELSRRIASQTQKIAQIAATCEDDIDPRSRAARLVRTMREEGLSNRIRSIYRATEKPLTVVDVHNQLKAIGYPLQGYQNVLATLHLTINRLREQKELRPVTHEGKKAFIWNAVIIRAGKFYGGGDVALKALKKPEE